MQPFYGISHAFALAFLLVVHLAPSRAFVAIPGPIRIDCGSDAVAAGTTIKYSAAFNPDSYYDGGNSYIVPSTDPSVASQPELLTLRAFPTTLASPCYSIPVGYGRYRVRLGYYYNNYDGLSSPPAFYVALDGVLSAHVNMSETGVEFTDLVKFGNGTLEVCFQSISGTPIVNEIQLLPADTDSFQNCGLASTDILRNKLRINAGGPTIGSDPEYRFWTADNKKGNTIATPAYYGYNRNRYAINGSELAPDFLPRLMYQSTRLANDTDPLSGYGVYETPVTAQNKWMVRFHFAEIEANVTVGQRQMELWVKAVDRDFTLLLADVDVVAKVGTLAATYYCGTFTLPGDSSVANFGATVLTKNGSALPAFYSGADFFEVIDGSLQDVNFGVIPELVPSPPPSPPSKDSVKAGTVIAIIVIIILVIVVLGLLVYFCILKKDRGSAVPGTAQPTEESPSYVARVSALASIFPNRPQSGTGEETPIRGGYESSSGGVFKA